MSPPAQAKGPGLSAGQLDQLETVWGRKPPPVDPTGSAPPANDKFAAFYAKLAPSDQALLDGAWADILTHDDIGGRNADYARRTRLIAAAVALLGYTP